MEQRVINSSIYGWKCIKIELDLDITLLLNIKFHGLLKVIAEKTEKLVLNVRVLIDM